MPKNLPSPPTYRKINPSDTPILILSVQSDVAPIIEVDDVAENILAQQISQISGVSLVRVGGQQTPAIRIQIDPAKLVEKNLQLEDVRAQIGIATIDSPKGAIKASKQAYTIFDNDQLTKADAVEQRHRRLSQRRASARARHRQGGGRADRRPRRPAWGNGKRDVFLVVFKQPGVNVIKTVEKIKQTMVHLTAAIPANIHVTILSDRTTTIRAAVNDVQFTLMLTIALVVMVIFVFLRNVWATFIPSITVPLALLGACALMWAAGYSLDNLSLMALTIAVGFVVDDAIVMLENITRHIEEGMKPLPGGAQGRGRDRLHHHFDLALADRGADSAAADERHHRPPVPRIRRHAGDDHRRLGFRVADIDADDGVALPQGARRRRSMAASTSSASAVSTRWRTATSAGLTSFCATASSR